MSMPSIRHQQGLALVSVLFITALVVALITAISHRQWLDIQLTSNLVFRTQAFHYVKSAELLATQGLYLDWDIAQKSNEPLVDDYKEQTFTHKLLFPIENNQGAVEAELFDLQGLFNLNGLVDSNNKVIPAKLEQLKRLIAQVATNNNLQIPSDIAESMADWIDEDNSPTGLGHEEGDYLVYSPAYRTPNYFFSSVDELMLMEGIQKEPVLFDVLSPFFSALPERATQLNVNTIPREVILSLDSKITESDVDTLIADREKLDEGYKDVNTFLQHQAFAGVTGNLDANDFTVATSFFLLKSRVFLGDRVVQAYSVLFRDPADGKTRVISRDLSKRYIPDPNKPLFTF
ncbi:type II secretion system minor pseudopilin GspK [Litoribrevibacter euphylliae]|uniref:Type II secretion system protein K n=1 Tax=Litoribrevibacter euphylliae TaxID=1834034 RepID=A0ABV7HK75_9GAMM